MIRATHLLRRVLGEETGQDPSDHQRLTRFAPPDRRAVDEKELERFDNPERMTRPDPTQHKLSRFATRHERAKPVQKHALTPEQAQMIAEQISNDGVEMIPLSVLQNALPDRIPSRGGLDSLPCLMDTAPLGRMTQNA